MNKIQSSICYLFNSNERLSFSDIKGHLGIDATEIILRFKNEIMPLINQRVLTIGGSVAKGKITEIGDDAILSVNMGFAHKAYLLKIKNGDAVNKVDESEDKAIYEEFMFEMKIKIESAVMRILKTHRS
jgi:hypothetical protein